MYPQYIITQRMVVTSIACPVQGFENDIKPQLSGTKEGITS